MVNKAKSLFHKDARIGLIEIWQYENQRWLTIDSVEQTRINIDQPDQLVLTLHYYFLSILLFIDTPNTVLLGGLGGGAIARYLHNKHSGIEGTAIEFDDTIASLASDYFYFPKNKWDIVVDDLRDFYRGSYDLIMVDIAEGELTPSWLTDEKMLLQLKRQLTNRGVLAINLLVADAQSFSQTLAITRKIFERRTLCVSVPDHKNIIIFAFNQQPEHSSMYELKEKVKHLTNEWGLDFSKALKQIEKDNPKGSGII